MEDTIEHSLKKILFISVETSLAAVTTPKDVSNHSDETETRSVETEKTKKTNVVVEKSTEKSVESKKSSTNVNDEEEIDDVEPDAEMSEAEDGLVEEIFDDEEEEEEEVVEPQNQHQDVDTSRLLASGVSVTIVEKSR